MAWKRKAIPVLHITKRLGSHRFKFKLKIRMKYQSVIKPCTVTCMKGHDLHIVKWSKRIKSQK